MTNGTHAAVKSAVEEEFGVTLNDSAELRLFVEAKMAEMNPIDRAAFEIRVGRILGENESGGPPRVHYAIVSWALFILVAWFMWRPVAVVLAISAGCINVRKFAIRNALFWSPLAALVIGGSYGSILAVVVRVGTVLTTQTIVGGVGFAILGFAAAGDVGYGVPRQQHAMGSGHEQRLLAQMIALASYVVVAGALAYTRFLR